MQQQYRDKELYYHSQGLPSPRPFTALEPLQETVSASPSSRGLNIAAELQRMKAGEARSNQTLNEVAQKDRLIDFLRVQLNIIRDSYRKHSEEVELHRVQEASWKQRQRMLEQSLENSKLQCSKLEFESKMLHLKRDASPMPLSPALEYEWKMEALRIQMQEEAKLDRGRAYLKQAVRKQGQSSELRHSSQPESEKKALQEKIRHIETQHKQQMERLQHENTELSDRAASLTAELEGLQVMIRNESLRRDMELQEYEMDIVRLKTQNEATESRNKWLQGQLSTLPTTHSKKLQEEISEKYITKINSMRSQLVDRITQIQQRYEQLQEAYQTERQSKELLLSQMEEMSSSVEGSRRLEDKEAEKAFMQERRVFAQKQLNYEEEAAELRLEVRRQQQLLELKTNELSAKNKQAVWQQERIAELEKQRKVLQEQLTLRQQRISAMGHSQIHHQECERKLATLTEQFSQKMMALQQSHTAEMRQQQVLSTQNASQQSHIFEASERNLLETVRSLETQLLSVRNSQQEQQQPSRQQPAHKESQTEETQQLQLREELKEKDELLNRVQVELSACLTQLELLDHQHQCVKSERLKLRQALASTEKELMERRTIDRQRVVAQRLESPPVSSKHDSSASSPADGREVQLEMENNWIKAQNSILQEDFNRLEGMFQRVSDELKKATTQLSLAESRRLEQVQAVQKLSRQRADRMEELQQRLEKTLSQHKQILQAEERSHSELLELEKHKLQAVRKELLIQLEQANDNLLRVEAQHLSDNHLTRQHHAEQIRKYADANSKLQQEVTRLIRQLAIMEGHLKLADKNYRKLKGRYEFIRQSFLAVQEGLEQDDVSEERRSYQAEQSIQPASEEQLGSGYCLTDELLMTNNYVQATIVTELSQSQEEQNMSHPVPEASFFELNLMQVEYSKTSEGHSRIHPNREYSLSEQVTVTPRKRQLQTP